MCPPPVRILSQLDPDHTPTSHILKMHLNMGCPNKSARFKVSALSSPTTQQSRAELRGAFVGYYSSSSSFGSATLVGFGLLNYRWVFSAGKFLQSALASGTSNPQPGGPVI